MLVDGSGGVGMECAGMLFFFICEHPKTRMHDQNTHTCRSCLSA